ncbi:helix-turn-helix domain-containing protein [Methylobacter sp.]
MATTPLAKELRIIRIKHDLSRAQMARDLGISDRVLALIEQGQSEVTDEFLTSVANRYADGDGTGTTQGNYILLLGKLSVAHANSVKSITFDMTGLNQEQRLRIMHLKNTTDREQKIKLEEEKLAKKLEKENRAKERRNKKNEGSAIEGLPEVNIYKEDLAMISETYPEFEEDAGKPVFKGGSGLRYVDDAVDDGVRLG